jgi:uncharacterized membrane protein YecN with MAPEG domain
VEWLALVCLLALVQYFFFAVLVGRARSRSGISAPATTGDPVFERTFRVQQNTMEQLVIFVPALFLFGHYVSSRVGALVGLAFVVGREMYAMGYIKDASKRGPGFLVTVVCQAILVVGAVVGVLRAIL